MGTGASDYIKLADLERAVGNPMPYSSYLTSTSTGTTLTEEDLQKAINEMMGGRYTTVKKVETPYDEVFRFIKKNIFII